MWKRVRPFSTFGDKDTPMPRSVRKRSEADIYHITVRGEGRQMLFENDDDCLCFITERFTGIGRGIVERVKWR